MDWKETVFATVLFATFTLAAVKHGWTQIEAFGGNVDPSVFIREAHEIARTGDLITSRDPPLRYVPLAFLYALIQPHGVLAEQIASLHAALFSFVVLPAGIACLAYVVGNRGIAYLSVIAFGMGRLFGFGTSGFQTGAWQYDIAAPLVFVTLAALHQSLSTTGIKSNQSAIAAGVTLGLAGMTQWTLTLLAITIVTVVYLVQFQYRNLALTGITGGVFATHLLFLPSSSNDLMFAGFIDRLAPESGGFLQTSHILASVSSPGFWLITIGVLTATLHQFRQNQFSVHSDVISVAIGVLYPIYIVSAIVNLQYIDWVVVQILIPIVYIGGIMTIWELINKNELITDVLPRLKA